MLTIKVTVQLYLNIGIFIEQMSLTDSSEGDPLYSDKSILWNIKKIGTGTSRYNNNKSTGS